MSKIPEGATHTAPDGTYRMARGSLWYSYADGDWVYIEGAAPHCYTKIQAEPEWDGKGMPPVGTVCEYQTWVNREWKQTKILAHHIGFAVHSWSVDGDDMEVEATPQQDFRPVRGTEQIAAEKRDAAIKEMQRLVGSCNTFPFAELYDYGYRLQVEK